MPGQSKKDADEIKKQRSEAAKKAAATRRAKAEEEQGEPQEQQDQQQELREPEAPRRFAGMDQNAAEEQRQAELAAAREYRNQKLGIG